MRFVKMHGLGNDFIFVNGFEEKIAERDYSELGKKLCDRFFGIGGDGLVFILPSESADIKMRIINSDGSEAEMCGNAIRCFAKYAYEQGLVDKTKITVETLAGIMGPELILENGKVVAVRVDMGEPRLNREQIPMLGEPGQVVNEALEVDGNIYMITTVSMGNPHCIIFVDDALSFPLTELGPKVEKHTSFPRKTNVEFVQVVNPSEMIMRVWERGAGNTLACGTGACATLVAGVLTGQTDRKAKVHLAGGTLEIEWAENNRIYMTGPATHVYNGELDLTLI